MNINILLLLPWPKLISPYILFGLYYGLLATLPIGPPQILCVRSFLLGGNLCGLVSLSGSMLAQLVTISSIYCSPIYLVLSKPHALTVLAIPYMLLFCLIIKDFPNYQILRPVILLRDPRLVRLFLISFLFQILNPIMLPNPVLTRLPYLFFFRYSTSKIFVIATVIGWLTGQTAFNYLSRLLLTRVERDSPMLYLLAKRSIYTTFSIVFAVNAVAYLGRSPVSFWTKKFMNESQDKEMSFWEIAEYSDLLWWFFKPWPISFFDPSRGNRGNRFVKNCRFDIDSSFYRGRTSTYFFEKCLTDGKERLSFAALPSLSIFEKEVYRSMVKSRRYGKTHFLPRNWISEKLARITSFQKELTDRIELLDTGSFFPKAMGKKTRLTGGKRRRIPYTYDPFVNNSRIRIPVPQTFLITDELGLTRWEWDELATRKRSRSMRGTAKRNVLKDWISAKNREWKQGNKNTLPWETLPVKSRRMFQFIFKNRVLYDYEVQKILKKIKDSSKPNITWEEIMDLDYEDRLLFLTYLKEGRCHQIDRMYSFKAFMVNDSERLSNAERKIRRLHKVEDLSMDLARNIALYFDNDFDVPGGDGDFRHRKLRNVGITSARGKPRSAKLVKRYAKVSDFRRKFLKGSMRSRRRKTLLWKALQGKIRSSFFLRSAEVPLLIQPPIKRLITLSLKATSDELEKNADYELGEQLLNTFPFVEKSLIGESKLVRSAVAARSDIGPIHNGRGYMLVFQSRFRKFIKLPVLIILKSIGRILLRQNSEWNKDWTKWRKEIHINCTFDGEEFSQDELPPRWLREGIQIKIVYPFRLKPWYTDESRKQQILQKEHMEARSSERQELKSTKRLKRKRPKFTYLTVLGYQTDVPFGTIQKETSFWKPVQKKLIRICKRGLPLQIRHVYQFIDSRFNLQKILKMSSISSKELNFISNFGRVRKVPSAFGSDRKDWIKTSSTNYISEMIKPEYEMIMRNSKSIAIGGEMHPASLTGKQFVDKGEIRKEFVAGGIASNPVNPLDKKFESDEPNPNKNLVDSAPVNVVLSDRNFINSARSERQQPADFGELILSLYFFGEEAAEEFVSIAINLFFTIDRFSVHYFNEFVAFYTQVTRVLSNINRKNNLLLKNGFPRLGSSSQACLYADIWNIGMGKDLNLNQLVNSSSEKINNNCRKNSKQGYVCIQNDGVSNLNQPEVYMEQTPVHYGSIATKFPSIQNKSNYVTNLTIYFDRQTDKTANQYFDENILKYIEKRGFLKKFCNLNEKNWNEWLEYLDRYNLPLAVWRNIAPRKWKVSLKELSSVEGNTANKLRRYISQRKLDSYSIYAKKSFPRDRIRNFSKLHKHRNLLQNLIDFEQNGDTKNLSVQKNVIKQKFQRTDRIRRISREEGKRFGKFVHFQNSHAEIRFNFQFDLMPWLNLSFSKMKDFSNFKKKPKGLKNFILKDNEQRDLVLDINSSLQEVSDELYEVMSDEREDADYIFRWKWKFEAELEKFRNLIALTRMLGDDQDLVTLCANTEINSDLLNLHFNATTKVDFFNNLSDISAHRLSLVFDDQDLLYKIINPLLKFKSRLRSRAKRRLYRNIYNDSYISKVLHILTERNYKQFGIYNIDDVLLPRRRREFRFLRCFLISTNSDLVIYSSHLISEIEKPSNGEKQHPPYLREPNEIQKIKRFLWPSHRLEEVACAGRFCLGVTTGSRFATLRIRMYPIISN
uniref:Protein TIC 214 n=1 Tax=Ynesmexia subcordata TaxID=2305849 RepID=A0A3G5CQF2_9MONI|nr:conserved hypothetical chloroplast protein Ycf1 [Hemionitis subcordata]AYW15097.1 conserved hypothetical chloroplast protein Ycf1 [Hemionitis subcordata]